MNTMKPVILVFSHYYLPGYKGGGPIQSIKNIVDSLSEEFTFLIVTNNRDLGDKEPYSKIKTGVWNTIGSAKVYYLELNLRSVKAIFNLIHNTPHDILYLNSFFATYATLFPLISHKLNRKLKNIPILLAPRGEFSNGALSLKFFKKTTYLSLIKFTGLLKEINWHASTAFEAFDITREVNPKQDKIFIASDLSSSPNLSVPPEKTQNHNELHIIFISRISPKKNLDYALKIIKEVTSKVVFNIYGPIEDSSYWLTCQAIIDELPSHIKVIYHGSIPSSAVPSAIYKNDLFFLPTLGENYGHVIAESLAVGTPVLISDQTPWRDLINKKLGFDIPLKEKENFIDAINGIAKKTKEERQELRQQTHSAIQKHWSENNDAMDNIAMFYQLLKLKPTKSLMDY